MLTDKYKTKKFCDLRFSSWIVWIITSGVRVYDDAIPGTEHFRVEKPWTDDSASETNEGSIFRFFDRILPNYSVDLALVLFTIFVGLAFASSIDVEMELKHFEWWEIIPFLVLIIVAAVFYLIIKSHPKRKLTLYFRVRSLIQCITKEIEITKKILVPDSIRSVNPGGRHCVERSFGCFCFQMDVVSVRDLDRTRWEYPIWFLVLTD